MLRRTIPTPQIALHKPIMKSYNLGQIGNIFSSSSGFTQVNNLLSGFISFVCISLSLTHMFKFLKIGNYLHFERSIGPLPYIAILSGNIFGLICTYM